MGRVALEGAKPPLTEAQEDYLKAIYQLAEGGTVGTRLLAERLSVRPASVTGMLKKLAELGLVVHVPYRGVRLTESGERVALEVIRHHRLLEAFLAEALGFPWEAVHAEADRLEHHISETFEARIAELLGHPERDPHGDPIPTPELTLPHPPGVRLAEAGPGDYRLLRVRVQDADLLRALARLGLKPGAMLGVLERLPAGVRLSVGGVRYLVPAEWAEALEVEPL